MLAKQEDVGSSSPKLDHHASTRIDDQSPTFSRFFPLNRLANSQFILLPKTFEFSQTSTSSLSLDPALFRKRLSLGEP